MILASCFPWDLLGTLADGYLFYSKVVRLRGVGSIFERNRSLIIVPRLNL